MARRPMPREEDGRAWIHVRVPVELKKEAMHRSVETGETITGMVERALRDLLKQGPGENE